MSFQLRARLKSRYAHFPVFRGLFSTCGTILFLPYFKPCITTIFTITMLNDKKNYSTEKKLPGTKAIIEWDFWSKSHIDLLHWETIFHLSPLANFLMAFAWHFYPALYSQDFHLYSIIFLPNPSFLFLL